MEPKTLSWLKSAASAALAIFAFSLCLRHDTPVGLTLVSSIEMGVPK
jgi:hypothetical protein